MDTIPKNVVFMDEILAIQSEYKGKKNHFNIKLKNGKGMHLKCNKDKDAEVWTQALSALLDVYSNKKLVDFDINRQYKDRVDIRISNMIMAELESKLAFLMVSWFSELQKARDGLHRM